MWHFGPDLSLVCIDKNFVVLSALPRKNCASVFIDNFFQNFPQPRIFDCYMFSPRSIKQTFLFSFSASWEKRKRPWRGRTTRQVTAPSHSLEILPCPVPPPKQGIQIAKLAKWKGGGSFSTQFANNVQSLRTQQAEQVYPSSELVIQRVMPEQKV